MRSPRRRGGGRFDLLLTDVVMSEMTGAELAWRPRQDDPDLKVLYVTSYSGQLLEEKVTLCREEAFLEEAVHRGQDAAGGVAGRRLSCLVRTNHQTHPPCETRATSTSQ